MRGAIAAAQGGLLRLPPGGGPIFVLNDLWRNLWEIGPLAGKGLWPFPADRDCSHWHRTTRPQANSRSPL